MRVALQRMSLVLAMQAVTWSAPTAAADAPATTIIDSIGVTVSDMSRSIDFYTRILTFEKIADREIAGDDYEHLFGVFGLRIRCARLRLGAEFLELMQFKTPQGRPIPVPSHSNDRWFQHIAVIVSDMEAAYARLKDANVEYASSSPQRLPDWNPDAGGIQAFYFLDPDGHNLEILAFPRDKGAARWHRRDSLFLGIAHSAIVVSNTAASLHFYHDILGLRVAGTSENYGIEQEHLNNVFGAHLHITALRADSGPGVEFLDYLSPRNGRAMPLDTQPNDLWYCQINILASEPGTVENRLKQEHAVTGSADAITPRDGRLGWRMAIIARDPDGHANLVTGNASVVNGE